MQTFDVLIVGGGPAGASCAWALRQAGKRVAILDQANFPRAKVCAGWITPAVLQALDIDPLDYGRDHVLQPINRFRIGLLPGPHRHATKLDINYPETVSYGILRREFDDMLLQRSGATLFTGETLFALRRDGDGWLLNEHIRAPMLVGAGGHTCPVARKLGAHPVGEETVVAKEIEFLLPEDAGATCKVKGSRPELYFCHDLAGYGWCIRKGHYLNLGLGRNDRWDVNKHVEEFLAFLVRERGVPLPPKHLNGHAYLLYGHSKREVVAFGTLLVGDAAGLAYPHSGEGIRPAVESGLLAAQTIIEAQGDYRELRLTPYLDRLRRRFAPGSFRNLALPGWLRVYLARQLFYYPALLRRVLLDDVFLHGKQNALPSPQRARP
jgi:menaquinone-9 beta-reductase